MAPPCQHMRLFGPARSAAELRGDADANGPVSAPPVAAVVLHVVVVEQRASRQQRLWSLLARLADDAASSGSSDSGNGSTDSGSMDSALGSPQRASLLNLLDQAELLELPLGDPAPLLGRRALPAAPHPLADGIPVAGLLEPFGAPPRRPQLQLPLQRARPAVQQGRAAAGPSPLALAAVDALFAGACCVAVVCTALLAADIWRNGWRGDGQARRGHPAGCLAAASEAQQQLTVPLLVVAAEEVEAHRCGKC